MLPPDPVYIFKGDMESVSCVAFKFTSCVEFIYAGTHAGIIHVWNLKNKKEQGNFKIGDHPCLAVHACDDKVIAQDKIGLISLWKENEGRWTFLNQHKTDFFGFCKFYIFQDFVLYSVLKNSKCQKISIKTFEPTLLLDMDEGDKLGEIMALKILEIQNKKVLLVACEGCELALWDEKEVKKISRLSLEDCPMALDFDVDSTKGICGNPTNNMLVFSINSSFHFKIENSIRLTNPGVASIRIRPDNKLVAVGCWDGKLRLYSWKTLVLLAVLDVHSATIQDVCFAKTSNEANKSKYLLIAGSSDCKMSLWDLYN